MTSINNNSNNVELTTPLIGNRPQHERDEEQGCMRPFSSLMPAMVYDDDEEESCPEATVDDSQWFNNSVVLVILPALLFLQFGMAFSDNSVQGTTGLQLSVVNSNIVMFVITAALYRQAVQEMTTCSLSLLLLPEIIMNVILGLVLCGQVVPAFLLLLSSMLCLAFFVVANSIRVLAAGKECNEDSIHDEIDAGFEPLWSL
jgi:hypothetical protein